MSIKNIFLIAISTFFIILLAYSYYPKPIEIITLYLIGGGIALFLFLAGKIIQNLLIVRDSKRTKLYMDIINILTALYLIVFYITLRVSFWDKKIVINLFTS